MGRDQTMRRTVTCLIATFCLAFACNVASAQTSKTIRLTNGEWQPFLSEAAPHLGFLSHIVTEAFALAGVEVEYGYFPWKRSMKLAREGKWDGAVAWVDTEERRQDFYLTDPVVPTKYAFFHRTDTPFDWNTFEDLKDVRVGGTLEYSYGKAFDAAEQAGVFKTHRAPNDETNLKKLLKERIKVFPGEVMVTYAQIRDTFADDQVAMLTHHPNLIHEQPLHLLLSKKVEGSEQMRDRFNEGLKKLKESGRYDQIMADALAGKYAKPQ
jgi:polar amino acid transport system substrate-binding protein